MSTQQVTVWFQLYIGNDKSGRADKIRLSQGDDMADFRKAVKAECHPNLEGWAPNELAVYPVDTTVPVSVESSTNPFDSGDAVPGNTTSKKPLVVWARPKVSTD